MGIFYVVVANKYLDTFGPKTIKAAKADGAMVVAKATFESHCKGGSKDTLAHFKLFANPLEAQGYIKTVASIQHQAGEYSKSESPEEWVASKASSLVKANKRAAKA